MAMRILSSRLLTSNLPVKACTTQCASMSSEVPAKKKPSNVGPVKKEVKRESLLSFFAPIWGGKLDPADPNDEPIDSKEIRFPHAVDAATGESKLLMLAFENGFIDPYSTLPEYRNGRGTKDNPVTIPSWEPERLVGCVCEPAQNHVKFTMLARGEPKRCSCGHWMELVDPPYFWEKIPKEDLIEIPYFKDLDDEGKLDLLLERKLDPSLVFANYNGH